MQESGAYLVTGGAGFIGSNIVRALAGHKARVRVLDDFSTGRRSNLQAVPGDIDLVEGDIRDPGTVAAAVDGMDYVIHTAALPSVLRSVKDPLTSNEVNVTGTLRVLLAARDAHVKTVVYSSSSSVYGDTPTLPKREDMPPSPKSPYALQKYTGECYCRMFHELYGLRTVMLRYFNVFGPRQDPASQYAAVIPLFIRALRDGRPPAIDGDGEQTRDFTFVDNVVAANLAACGAEDAACGVAYNVGCGARHSINALAKLLGSIMKKTIAPVHGDPRPGDVRDSEADLSRIRQALGWEPAVSFEDGLRRTAAFILENE